MRVMKTFRPGWELERESWKLLDNSGIKERIMETFRPARELESESWRLLDKVGN